MLKLCAQLPVQFSQYMTYVRGLTFEESPDYDMLEELLDQVAQEHNFSLTDNVFDWSVAETCTPPLTKLYSANHVWVRP